MRESIKVSTDGVCRDMYVMVGRFWSGCRTTKVIRSASTVRSTCKHTTTVPKAWAGQSTDDRVGGDPLCCRFSKERGGKGKRSARHQIEWRGNNQKQEIEKQAKREIEMVPSLCGVVLCGVAVALMYKPSMMRQRRNETTKERGRVVYQQINASGLRSTDKCL